MTTYHLKQKLIAFRMGPIVEVMKKVGGDESHPSKLSASSAYPSERAKLVPDFKFIMYCRLATILTFWHNMNFSMTRKCSI